MQSAIRKSPGGPVQLRMQSDRLKVRYAMESEVILVSEESGYEQPASSALDYRQCNPVRRRELAKSLSRDIVPAQRGELLHSSTLQWAVSELRYRVPLAISPRVVSAEESRAVVNMQAASVQDFQELQAVRTELNHQSVVVVILHSEGPLHYTLLRRVVSGGVPVYTYWDSLPAPSASARVMAEKFMDRLIWTGGVPAPVNRRFQSDGWECGLFCIQFLEECLREARRELVVKKPVNLSGVITRVNEFIGKVKPFLAAPVAVPSAPYWYQCG